MDKIDKNTRSRNMSLIKSKNTSPELLVRKWLHAQGFRFRIHKKNLPGTPDIVLPKHNLIVFINGCFWHQHPGCKRERKKKSNKEYWIPKLEKNIATQRIASIQLCLAGWRVLILWECEIRNSNKYQSLLRSFLNF